MSPPHHLRFLWNFTNCFKYFSDIVLEMNYYENSTVTGSNHWPWANMLRNMNKCENGRSNFSATFRIVALKLTELIRFALPNQWLSSIPYVPLHDKWRHHEISFFELSLHLLPLVYILWMGSTVSDGIVRKWLWSTANIGVAHCDTSVALLDVVDNRPD